MLGILLRLFSVLGIVLLAVIGLALFALLLVLFVPVSYSLDGVRDLERMDFHVKLRWLFGLVRADIRYPTPGAIWARIFGIRVFDSGRVKEKASKGSKETAKEKAAEAAGSAEGSGGSGSAGNAEKAGSTEKAEKAEDKKTVDGAQNQDVSGRGDSASASAGDKSSSPLKLRYYWELLQEEDAQQLILHGFFRLGRILRGIRPRTIRGQIRFGTGSPDTTGYCMAVYGMLFPYLGENITLTPDFEEAVLVGECSVKGYVSVAAILFHSGSVLFDRRLRKVIKSLKKGGSING